MQGPLHHHIESRHWLIPPLVQAPLPAGTTRQGEYTGQVVVVAPKQPERRLTEAEYIAYLEV